MEIPLGVVFPLRTDLSTVKRPLWMGYLKAVFRPATAIARPVRDVYYAIIIHKRKMMGFTANRSRLIVVL